MSTNCSTVAAEQLWRCYLQEFYIHSTYNLNKPDFSFLRKPIYLAFKLVLNWILLTWLFFLDHWMNEFQKPIDLDLFLGSLLLFKWAFSVIRMYIYSKISSWTSKSLYDVTFLKVLKVLSKIRKFTFHMCFQKVCTLPSCFSEKTFTV